MDFLYSLTEPENALMLLAGLAAFATIVTLAMPLLVSDKLGERMKYVATEREALRRQFREDMARQRTDRLRHDPRGFVKKVVDQLNLHELLEGEEIKGKLKQAGLRGQAPLYTFLFFRFVAPIILGLGTLLYLFLVDDFDMRGTARIAIAFGAMIIGFYLPNIVLQNMVQRRQESIQRAFPDALDLLLICVESGMSIEAAFGKVSTEVGNSSIELMEEMTLTTAELSYLQDRRVAYENLASRTGLPGVKGLCMSLIQAERYGTPLGQALRVMAQENRDIRMAAAEKKAAALPPKLTVPMIAFFLPALFAVILGPAAIQFMN
ncbi:type II secretion system protein [Tepidicaulis marinus]|uniref:Type II secretion system protein n=1 Tax=Tepidicaulis marinus TaxID=1333998 RepID=A0A081BBB2_9HYPH|nr:type II secretion system F family protein [Tepidicaulis marinus]GAK45330.1 type II secretion system protein [Tepidicaulis marinus]